MKQYLSPLFIAVVFFSCSTKSEPIPEKPAGWEIFETPVQASLRGLSPVTREIAWASGSGGTWLRTLDGGKTWSHGVIAGLDTVDFRSIYAFDAENAVVISAGQPAVIYRTADGGQSWVLKHQESDLAFFDGVSFADIETGYVVGDPVDGKWMILKTINQGESWYSVSSPSVAAEGEAAFAASASSILAVDELIALGSGGTESNLYVSSDGGSTWEKFHSPLIQGESSQGIFALASLGDGEIVAVGGDYLSENDSSANFGKFSNADKKWASISDFPKGYRSALAFFPKFGWLIASGPTGSDYSEDGGLTWESFSKEGFHSVKIGHTEASVWASGSKGKVARLKY